MLEHHHVYLFRRDPLQKILNSRQDEHSFAVKLLSYLEFKIVSGYLTCFEIQDKMVVLILFRIRVPFDYSLKYNDKIISNTVIKNLR